MMPEFTITLSKATVERLQAVVQQHNQRSGESLTVKQWIVVTLKSTAIQQELGASITSIREQQEQGNQAALEAAIAAEQDRLLGEIT